MEFDARGSESVSGEDVYVNAQLLQTTQPNPDDYNVLLCVGKAPGSKTDLIFDRLLRVCGVSSSSSTAKTAYVLKYTSCELCWHFHHAHADNLI